LTELGYDIRLFKSEGNLAKIDVILTYLYGQPEDREEDFIESYLGRPTFRVDFILFNKDNHIFGMFSRGFNKNFLENHLNLDMICGICYEMMEG
jgi:hypothetical protein